MATNTIYPNGTADIVVAQGDKIAIGSFGSGVATIHYSTLPSLLPEQFYLQQSLTNSQVLLGTFAADRVVRISAGIDPVEYSTGSAPTLSNVFPGNLAGASAAQGVAVSITGGASTTSANAGGAAAVTGGAGGATGVGGAVAVTSGAGGSTSGASGAVTVTTGVVAVTATGTASNAGAIALSTAAGGAATGNGTAGNGGALTATSGNGGAAAGTGAAVGGVGGAAAVTSGTGGAAAGTSAAGAGGAASLVSGAGGAKTGTGTANGGAGGAIAITGGVGGATASTSPGNGGAGADINVTAGNGGAASAGTANGGAGGTMTLTPGTGGTSAGGTAGVDGVIIMRGIVGVKQGTPTAKTVSATLTTTEVKAGIITVNQAAAGASAQQLPLASAMDTAFPDFAAGDAYDFYVINTSTVVSENASVTTNTGWTLVGSMDIYAYAAAGSLNSSAKFRARKTGTATWTLYRLC